VVAPDIHPNAFLETLRQHILPHYRARGRAVSTAITDNSRSWHGHACDSDVANHGIECMKASTNPLTRGKIERQIARLCHLNPGGVAEGASGTITVKRLHVAYDLLAQQCNQHIVD